MVFVINIDEFCTHPPSSEEKTDLVDGSSILGEFFPQGLWRGNRPALWRFPLGLYAVDGLIGDEARRPRLLKQTALAVRPSVEGPLHTQAPALLPTARRWLHHTPPLQKAFIAVLVIFLLLIIVSGRWGQSICVEGAIQAQPRND